MAKKESHLKDGIIDFTAGSFGGVALVYIGQPLDTVKVKMQSFPTLYKNMFQCFRETLRNDGIYRGLYAGTVPALATNVVENSTLFLCYGLCQKFMVTITNSTTPEDLSTTANATAGFLAAFFSGLAITPTELIKCKLQAMYELRKQGKLDSKDYIGPAKLTRQIIKTEGIAGLFTGLTPTLLREMPGYFFFFGGYEGTRALLCKEGQKKEDLGLWKTMISGAVGGGLFWTMTFPVDVAKSIIQVNSLKTNLVTVMIDVVKKDGILGLYNGLLPTLFRTLPSTAALFATYEYSKKAMHYIFRDF